jgi:hypothetical protein
LSYVVDYLGFVERQCWTGDQDDWEPKPYSKEKRRGKAEPFNITLTKHCNGRSEDGWHLHSVTPNAVGDITGSAWTQGVWLVFERARS